MSSYNNHGYPPNKNSGYKNGGGEVNNFQDFDSKWITDGLNNEAVIWIEKCAKNLTKDKKLTTSQFRNIFGEIRSIQQIPETNKQKKKNRIVLLKPKIAYAQKKGSGFPEEFKKTLDRALELVINASDEKFNTNFNNFVDFVEALLAYHKAHDKK